jgi:hypothetical protein
VVATATFLTLSFGISAVLNLLHLSQSGALKMFADAFKGASPSVLVLGVLVLGVGAGICEEALFRGYLQTRLVERWGRWPGILLTAACFALVHFDVAQGLFAFFVGMFLGWLTARAGSIRPAMLVHAINNSISVLLSAGGEAPSGIPSAMNWIVPLLLLALTAGGVAGLARRLPVGDPVDDRGGGGCP